MNMKLTTKILIIMLLLFTTGLFASNMLLKKIYDNTDKSDTYWTYGKILEQPFHHLKIDGGNITRIAYEQSKTFSVRVLKEWYGYETGIVKAHVQNDTLYINFPNTYKNIYEKDYYKWNTMVRIFSPELLSVTGIDTKLEMYKLHQNNLSVNMSGKSEFEVESLVPLFDTLRIMQTDSSEVVFEMDPNLKSSGSFRVKSVFADIRGKSFLDIGHAQVDFLQLTVADSSGILLSGGTMKKNQLYNFNKTHP
jgi:hypothetical protein